MNRRCHLRNSRNGSQRLMSEGANLSVVLKLCPTNARIVSVQGPLRRPVSRALRDSVRAFLRGGERVIVVDLADVTRIDAAGVGELVRAFNLTAAANGRLRIVNASPWVREVLDRAGVFGLLAGTRTDIVPV
jgi:anti-anti-sigma factor